eukprot:121876-Pelagomonas_calceolata.AAC.2
MASMALHSASPVLILGMLHKQTLVIGISVWVAGQCSERCHQKRLVVIEKLNLVALALLSFNSQALRNSFNNVVQSLPLSSMLSAMLVSCSAQHVEEWAGWHIPTVGYKVHAHFVQYAREFTATRRAIEIKITHQNAGALEQHAARNHSTYINF